MPRPRTPTKVLELKGAFEKNPQRKREGEPVPVGEVAPPPTHLNAREQRVYIELVEAAPPGVLTSADTQVVSIAARLEAEWRRDGSKFPAGKIGQLVKALAQMGMTPADRSKISLGKPEEAGKFDDF